MRKLSFTFSSATVQNLFGADISFLSQLFAPQNTIVIIDENVYESHKKKLASTRVIILKPGEENKNQQTVDHIISQLITMEADRQTVLVGIGGGVITDITGYVASVYMRGLTFGFVPTSILAMVDAAIGGKNGIDVGIYKNMVGTIRQPAFILYDYSLLKSLPKAEWVNGFAEIIKHGAIKDAVMFKMLEEHSLTYFQKDTNALAKLVQRNAVLKSKVVQADEFEQGERKTLNFGHTLGHAIENVYNIPHGHAISIGMGVAARLSQQLTGFADEVRLTKLLKKYGLPPQFQFDKEKAIEVLQKDKKKAAGEISFICLQKIGKAVIKKLPMEQFQEMIRRL